MNTRMCRAMLAAAVLLGSVQASADDPTLKWQTIIGIIQAGNVVAGIPGGGQPWSTLGGNASVNLASGRVHFRVDGLVLAGGNNIGTPGAVVEVKGTLVCNTTAVAPDSPTIIDTPLVPLNAVGDAIFNGDLGPLPDVCASSGSNVAFLIRIGAGRWIANGAVLLR